MGVESSAKITILLPVSLEKNCAVSGLYESIIIKSGIPEHLQPTTKLFAIMKSLNLLPIAFSE
jgi:hypothetical protein